MIVESALVASSVIADRAGTRDFAWSIGPSISYRIKIEGLDIVGAFVVSAFRPLVVYRVPFLVCAVTDSLLWALQGRSSKN